MYLKPVDDFRQSYKLLIHPTNKELYSNVIEFELINNFESKKLVEMLELRRLAYVSAGKIPSTTEAEDLLDRYDEHSIILIGKSGNQIVASLRMTFCHENWHRFEHEQFFALPSEFPNRSEIIEVSRLCVHPDFKGTDLVMGLFQSIGLVMSKLQKCWILGSSTKGTIKTYLSLGGKLTGIEYDHKLLSNQKHYVFLVDTYKSIIYGKCHPFIWVICFMSKYSEIKRNFKVNKSIFSPRVTFYKLSSPLLEPTFLKMRANRKNRPVLK